MRIWFHGTKSKEAADSILAEGFRAGTYFADALEDALGFGGDWVFEVALEHLPIREGAWQMRVIEAVPASAIVNLTHYSKEILADFPDRRKVVFDFNMARAS